MMKNKKLSEQLILIILIIIFAIFILIGILLPRQMLPIYEKNIYDYLRQPLEFVDEEKEMIKKQVNDYHRYYDLINRGDLYRLILPTDNVNGKIGKCAGVLGDPGTDRALQSDLFK